MQASTTAGAPCDITVRRMKFALDADVPRYWHSDSPSITHLFNALSVVFPGGEKFFIDSVREFENAELEPRTREEVRAFVQQEAHHTHQHRLLNALGDANGLPLARVDTAVGKVLRFAQRVLSAKVQLAVTVALEHFTAVMANQLLTEPRFSEGMHPAVKPLWLWHAVEETEHKAVCFDVYQQVGGSHWVRVLTMARIMVGFPISITFLQLWLLARDGKLFDLADVARGLRFVWGRGGFWRGIWPELKAYYRRDFHPWHTDNHALIAGWQAQDGHTVRAEGQK